MAKLSDIIENFIKNMISESGGEQIQIQRNELADQFSCAPSQINYVLTTRFTYERGYVIESRRGGGGCIVIKQLSYDGSEERNNLLYEFIGNSITNNNALSLIECLVEANLITLREAELIKIATNDRTLTNTEDRNRVRADILKGILIVILS